MPPRTASVVAAFFPWGFRKALTPLAIASTPVSAVEPDENARRRTKRVTPPVPAAIGFGTTACGGCPRIVFTRPTPTRANITVTKPYVGSANARPDSRTPRRLTRTITPRHASESTTLWLLSDGASEVTAKMPAAIDTATVST